MGRRDEICRRKECGHEKGSHFNKCDNCAVLHCECKAYVSDAAIAEILAQTDLGDPLQDDFDDRATPVMPLWPGKWP